MIDYVYKKESMELSGLSLKCKCPQKGKKVKPHSLYNVTCPKKQKINLKIKPKNEM